MYKKTLFPLSVWAQETEIVFKGAVTDVNGKGIANVLCKVLNAKDSLLAYSISRSDGQYILKCKKQATKLSFANLRKASRTGVALTLSCSEIFTSFNFTCGFNVPVKIACFKVTYTCSLNGKRPMESIVLN